MGQHETRSKPDPNIQTRPEHDLIARLMGGKGEKQMVNSGKKKRRLSGDNVKRQEALPKGDSTKTPEIVEKEHVNKDMPPVVIGLHCNMVTFSRNKKKLKNLSNEDKSPKIAEAAETLSPNLEGKEFDASGKGSKRKRGRPPKSQVKSPEVSVAVNNHENENGVENVAVEKQKHTSKVNTPKSTSGSVHKPVKGKRGKRRTISSINVDSSTLGKANGGGLAAYTVSDDQPLSRWFHGVHSLEVDSTVANKKQQQQVETNKSLVQNGGLSFEKRSSLWQTFEAMEVFRSIPQNPHYKPLNTMPECSREGHAISKLVTFFHVVENTSKLQFNDPRSRIEEYLEILVDLETYGFDVELVRNRLTELLLIKDEQEEIEARSKEAKRKMNEEDVEGERIEKEIALIDVQLKELTSQREKLWSKKEKRVEKVGALEAEVNGFRESLIEAQNKFDGLVAASLQTNT